MLCDCSKFLQKSVDVCVQCLTKDGVDSFNGKHGVLCGRLCSIVSHCIDERLQFHWSVSSVAVTGRYCLLNNHNYDCLEKK